MTMTEDEQGRQKKRRRLWLALAALVVHPGGAGRAAVPEREPLQEPDYEPDVRLAGQAGAPVSVELRLLPRPGFVLYDLTVEEDPAFGAEPLLHANTVTASIRLLSLWRGRLEISEISVDEASLNLVRSPAGRWNLDPLFQHRRNQGRHGSRQAQIARRRCLISRPPTPASTSKTARRSCRFRWSTPTSRSGRRSPATGASGCAASRPAPT